MSTARALSVRGLAKRFGALVVAQEIDLDLAPGARVALIGPNGAGKTTFVNLLTGFLEPDGGRIELSGESLQGLRPEQRVRRGLVRTHQINQLLADNTARDNLAIAIAERDRHAWRLFRFGRQWGRCREEAQQRAHCLPNRKSRQACRSRSAIAIARLSRAVLAASSWFI